MIGGERKEFLEWYKTQNSELFDNRRVLGSYCKVDVTDLREACRVFRRSNLQIGNFEVFLKSLTITSACNKLLRRKFLKSETIGLKPTEGYTCKNKYS